MTVLALRAAGLGDLLTAVPALRALSQSGSSGSADVVVATNRWLFDLVPLIPGVSGACDVDGLRPRNPPRSDLVVNLHGCGPQSHRALFELGRDRLLAYRCPGTWSDGPDWSEEESERERWCRLLRWAGIPADPTQVQLRRPTIQPPRSEAIVLHLGAASPERRWPASSFASLVKDLPSRSVVLTGLAEERSAAEQVIETAGLDPAADLTGRLGLVELAALVSSARLVVSGDTGMAHLAVAYGIPSVTIFGAASPVRWGPPPLRRHRVLRESTANPPSVADVPFEDVAQQVGELLAEEPAA